MRRSRWLGTSVAVVFSVVVGVAAAIGDGPAAVTIQADGTATPSASTVVSVEFVAAPAQTPVATAAPTRVLYLQPFPVVRVAGSSVRGGAYINMLRVTAPGAARVEVTCDGKGCPFGRLSRGPGRIRQLERFLRVGVTVTIRVTRSGYVGKYVRLVIRSRAAPKRRDACLLPDSTQPARCPG